MFLHKRRFLLPAKLFIAIILLSPLYLDASAQELYKDSVSDPGKENRITERDTDPGFYHFYSYINGGTRDLPFWMYANRHGLIRPGSRVNFISGFASETQLTARDSNIDIRLGAELVSRISDLDNTLHLQQFYGTARYRKFMLRIGNFYRMNDFDPSIEGLTTGFMIESHNATPYPRISIETDGFVEVPQTGGELFVRFRYSDGILESNRTISSPYIHQKSLQFRAVISRVSLQLGVFHSVMWAGRDDERGRLPRSFNDYMRIVFSLPASEDSDATTSEMLNRLGNSTGIYEAGFAYRASGFRIVGYRHLFLEDEFSVKFQSPWDGIWGLGFIRDESDAPIRAIIYEHLNSIRQESRIGLPQGRANFYNHAIYTEGWSYRDRVMGNPLFSYDPDENRVFNNVIIAHHLGISGAFSGRVSYRTMLTYSRNYGVCRDQIISGSCNIKPGDPLPEGLQFRPRSELRQDRLSGLIDLNYLLLPSHNLKLHFSLAADTGDFFGRRIGFMTGVSIAR
jgi:hypothetical protein